MGAFSTVAISRTAAKKAVAEYVERCGDEELGRVMDQILADRLYNVQIVEDGDPQADDGVVENMGWTGQGQDGDQEQI